jgi:ribose 5-phosphate isomerase B
VRIAIAFDHRGVRLREAVFATVAEAHEPVDLGVDNASVRADYPDQAIEVGNAIRSGQAERAVLVCGSGVGASIVANRIAGVRAAICHDGYSARQGVEHDDMNVLCLGADALGPELASDLVRTFLAAEFDGEERHAARLRQLEMLEQRPRD